MVAASNVLGRTDNSARAVGCVFGVKRMYRFLSIRSSNIAFTMGAKGPLLEMADYYQDNIEVF